MNAHQIDHQRPIARCTVRGGKPDDLAYVVDSWTKHARTHKHMRDAVQHVRALLGRSGSRLFVAHVPDEPDAILGWAVLEDSGGPWSRPVVHYVYCRASGRRQGVARALLGELASHAVDYSSAWPSGFAAPKTWAFNAARAKTATESSEGT